MNLSNINNHNSLDVIDELNLPPEQYKAAEKYILGEADDGILEQFTLQDISGQSHDNSMKALDNYIKTGQLDEARRLFNILFAIGQSTCHTHIPISVLDSAAVFTPEAAYKRAAVYSVKISLDNQEQELNSTHLDYLINISKGIENLKKAAACQKGTENGKIILLALYFTEKYTKKLLDENQASDNPQISIENDDLPLFQEYEKLILNRLDDLFQTSITRSELAMITEAISNDNIDKQILSLTYTKGLWRPLPIKLLGAMSYINYPLSFKLKNVVCICFSIDAICTLGEIDDISYLLAMSIRKLGGDYDKLFGIDSKAYIRWAADHNHMEILSHQLETNKEVYLSIIDAGLYDIWAQRAINNMYKIIERQKPDLYQALMEDKQKNGRIKGIKSLADILAGDSEYSDAAREYLLGNSPIDTLYPYADEMAIRPLNGSNKDTFAIHQYFSEYEDEEMRARCLTYMQFKHVGYNICCCQDVWDANNHRIDEQNVKKLFNYLEKEGLDVKYQLSVFETLYNYTRSIIDKTDMLNASKKVFNCYLKTHREKLLSEFAAGSQVIKLLALSSLALSADENKKEILAFSQDTSKVIKDELMKVICEQKHWKDDIKALALSKKAKDRELGVRVLTQWQNEGADYSELFKQLLEKEKSAKLIELIERAQNNIESNSSENKDTLSADSLVEQLHRGGKKRTLAWAYEMPFSSVHEKNGREADEKYLQAVLLCYATAEENGINRNAELLSQYLDEDELAVYVGELFDKWLASGAEAKKRWVLYASSIHGGSAMVSKLYRQIGEWAQHSRGAIAADAVKALALNPTSAALLTVDDIARKSKFRQVKAAAEDALDFAALQLNITREELADRIIPDLGFDENMERIFDYGGRSFKVAITTALEVEVFDGSGKKLKNLPAVAKKDDPEKAAAAYEEFKQMKRQMKTITASQRERLELALSVRREWSVEAWNALFVKNPIMHQFAIGLIWGLYEDGELIKSFRYMEDGSFNTEDEEEYTLPENDKKGRGQIGQDRIGRDRIGLVHPIELTDMSLLKWRQQLEDYEIKQPIEQLDRTVYKLSDDEIEATQLERFSGCTLSSLTLNSRLMKMGWSRGSAEDGGVFYTYYREDAGLGFGVELRFSGCFAGSYDDEKVTVNEVKFYDLRVIDEPAKVEQKLINNWQKNNYKRKATVLSDIPQRYFSEIVLQLTKATA